MILAIALSLIAGALAVYYLLIKDMFYFKKHGIPNITPIPGIGNLGWAMLRRESLAELVQRLYHIHPAAKYVGMYDLTKPIVVLRDPELIKSIAHKHFETFCDHLNFVDETTEPLFGRNLLNMRGEKWKRMRSVLSPAFTSSKMKSMYVLMSNCAADFADYVANVPAEMTTVDTKYLFTRYTNDVIATCAYGASVDSMRNPKNEFYVYGRQATFFGGLATLKFFLLRSLPWLGSVFRVRIIRQEVAEFFQRLVQETIDARDAGGIVRPDMLQLMMDTRDKETGKRVLSIEDMTAQAFVFFFAGFDSTSTLLCFAAHEIATNPQVQARLRTEIDQVLEDNNGQVTYEAVNAMEYLDAVISEALRMYPVAIAMDRVCRKDFELPPTLPGSEPYTVRKGQGVLIPAYGLQRDPKYFEQPDSFVPERFMGERKRDNLNCGAYVPFGLGPRMCIGNRFALLETKVLFFHLLARCRLEPCAKTPSSPIVIARDGFNLKPKGGFWLSVLPREDPHRTVIRNVSNGGCEL